MMIKTTKQKEKKYYCPICNKYFLLPLRTHNYLKHEKLDTWCCGQNHGVKLAEHLDIKIRHYRRGEHP